MVVTVHLAKLYRKRETGIRAMAVLNLVDSSSIRDKIVVLLQSHSVLGQVGIDPDKIGEYVRIYMIC